MSADSGYELGNTGYRLADVDVLEDSSGIAMQGSLKDSNVSVFRHRLASEIQLSNNSPSPPSSTKSPPRAACSTSPNSPSKRNEAKCPKENKVPHTAKIRGCKGWFASTTAV
jgi:hypothetical protein